MEIFSAPQMRFSVLLQSSSNNSTALKRLRIEGGNDLVKLPLSSFQELCSSISTLPCPLDRLVFWHIDLGYDNKLMDAICPLFLATAGIGLYSAGELGENAMEALSKALASPKCVLERLWISDKTRLGNEGLDGLLKHLSPGSSARLRSLELVDIGFDDRGAEVLARAAASSKLQSLEELHLQYDHIGDKNFKLLCEALQGGHLPHLSVLRLELNGIEEEGATSLGGALESGSCSLHRLCITWNDIGYKGVECLMKALPSSKIQDLTLSIGMPRREDSAEKYYAIAGTALVENPQYKLTRLSLGFTYRLEATNIPQVFIDGLSETRTLQELVIEDRLTPDAQARLGAHLRHSSLVRLDCRTFEHEDLFQGMLASKIHKLNIWVTPQNLDMVCDLILGNPDCNLQSLEVGGTLDMWMQKQMLEALDRNYQSHLEELYVTKGSEALDAKCSELLKRNSIFRAARASDKEAYMAKLFLCGPTQAGKTTIKTNISRKKYLPLPACLQRHPSTSGIELQPLSFTFNNTEQKLLICDMAGQYEFHAFHHSFLRGFDKSMFLVVLRVDNSVNRKNFTTVLVYWLRFIPSHKPSSSKRKPKVFIALNLFSEKVTFDTLVDEVVCIIGQYWGILDIDENILKVKAIKARTLQVLKSKLRKSLQILLSQQLRVPGLCEDAKEMCIQLKKNKMQIVEVQDIGKQLLVKYQKQIKTSLDEAQKQNMIKFVFLFLHDLGEVVYFDSISKYAILDVEWFIRDVISLFIDPQKINISSNSQQQMVQDIHAVADKLFKHCQGEQAKVEYIFQCLYEMGVLIPIDDGWTGTWKPLPKEVALPALSGIQLSYAPFDRKQGEKYKYWGRRLECKDVTFKLFPSGIFAMIQAKLHKECKNPSFDVGSGWVSFNEDRLGVYVRIGGDTDSWTDRQWVESCFWHLRMVV
ncbi:uncharacterized protein LOC9637593 [Selaginella moellendorffii]|uniref:uncharacterized protein LOC9637593 n=1 Tax=Selaginella moellendorffii TaxID=88036 RepID=UPI000D1C8D50|nr:uncharacterized protein LOC9637593 [Selaginella moellendorffii]|eukprot:XP_024519179.1 uncharacterized protein LOC9637593 [Selaginella moellendorffii]